ncbi:MAG: extracellular solute-binding protein [Anaerolineaceae bacterium]|nr:MAG: extracellular solute-binding protein [Anaerolineaceae bacterium]
MKNTDLLKIFAMLLVFVLLLAACGGGEEAAPAEEEAAPAEEEAAPAEEEVVAEAPAGKTTIEFWLEPDEACHVEVAVDAFNAQSDTVFVEAVLIEDPWDPTRTAIAAGEGPDIVNTPGPSFVFELVQAGQLMSLDEMSDVHGWGDRFAPFALNLGSVEGQLYSLPDEMETLVVYYNKTLFEENGWEIPTTMDELHALSEEIDAAGIIPFGHANADWRPANEWYVGEYLNHVAGPDKVYQALTGEVDWTDPDFVLAIEMLNEAQQNGWYMGGLEFYYTTLWDDFHVANATGEAAMNIEGTWSAADINEVYFVEDTGGNEWDWFPVPTLTGDTVFDIGMGNTKSINANSEHPEEAAEFLDFYFSPEIQAERFVQCGLAPAPVKIPEGTITGVDPRIASIFEELSAAAAAGDYGYTTWTFWPPKSDVYIYEEIEKVWAGDITPLEYLEGLEELFQEEFDAGEIPPIPER